MELEDPGSCYCGPGGLTAPPVNKTSHVFTIAHVAKMLGESQEWLWEVANGMDTEDGQLWVIGVGEDGVMAFTSDGIENLKELAAMHKEGPSIIEERQPIHAEAMKPKTENPTGSNRNRPDQRAWGLRRVVTVFLRVARQWCVADDQSCAADGRPRSGWARGKPDRWRD